MIAPTQGLTYVRLLFPAESLEAAVGRAEIMLDEWRVATHENDSKLEKWQAERQRLGYNPNTQSDPLHVSFNSDGDLRFPRQVEIRPSFDMDRPWYVAVGISFYGERERQAARDSATRPATQPRADDGRVIPPPLLLLLMDQEQNVTLIPGYNALSGMNIIDPPFWVEIALGLNIGDLTVSAPFGMTVMATRDPFPHGTPYAEWYNVNGGPGYLTNHPVRWNWIQSIWTEWNSNTDSEQHTHVSRTLANLYSPLWEDHPWGP